MISPKSRRRLREAAFNLIEMTVVILIIATLAAFILTGASGVLDRARKTKIKNDETQIVTAVNAYYTEYGKYPMADARQGTDTLYGKSNTAPGNEDVFNVLRAIAAGVNALDVLNPRKIIFFSGKDGGTRPRSAFATAATTDTQGNPINIGAFVDPYGNAYMVAIDGSYDGAIVDPSPYLKMPATLTAPPNTSKACLSRGGSKGMAKIIIKWFVFKRKKSRIQPHRTQTHQKLAGS